MRLSARLSAHLSARSLRFPLQLAIVSMAFAVLPSAWAGPASGTFTASRSCEAFQSFRKSTNPGDIKLSPGTGYAILESHDAGWTRVEVPGAKPAERWVPNDCGSGASTGGSASPSPAPGNGKAGSAGAAAPVSGRALCQTPDQHDGYVLAMSWQPGFCEWTPGGKRGKPECEAMESGQLTVTHLTLHGLWPNRQSCGISYGNCGGEPMKLSRETIAYIGPWMPNFLYESKFGQYEWAKHGTCQTTLNADAYFRRAVDLVKQVDESEPGKYIRANIGGTISRKAFYEKLRETTGSDQYSDSVTLLCSGKYLTEIRVRLPRDYKAGGSLKELLGDTPQRGGGETCKGDDIRIEASGRR